MKYLSFKKTGVLFAMGILSFVLAALTGCVKQDFDEPPVNIPHYNGTANATMDTLAKIYGIQTDTMLITQNIIIKGVVAANDQSGNIYKKLFIQDTTAGIDVEIDAQDMYTTFKVGQRVYIECKGLYLGLYGSAIELGYSDSISGTIGRMPAAIAAAHIFRDSLPGKIPEPVVLDPASGGPFGKYVGMLVAIPKVRFPDAGQPIVTGGATTSRTVGDADGNPLSMDGNSVILYTSNYADFGSKLLPQGVGTVQGIFTVFSTKYEILLRDMKDLVAFADTGQKIIYQNNFDADPGAEWPIHTVTGNKPWTWSSTYTAMTANGYGGSGACETWLMSPALDLTDITNPILKFNTWTKYSDGGMTNPFEVKVSTDYAGSGDPTGATWTDLQCTLSPAGSGTWTSSGDISLASYHQKVYIAFRYRSSGGGSNTSTSWEMDTFKLTGKKQ